MGWEGFGSWRAGSNGVGRRGEAQRIAWVRMRRSYNGGKYLREYECGKGAVEGVVDSEVEGEDAYLL